MTTPLGTLTHEGSDSVITFTRTYRVSAERLWNAIATAEGLAGWLATGMFESGPGGRLLLEFGDDQTVSGVVTAWNPYEELAHTWVINDEVPSELTYRLSEENGSTTLTLVHRKLPDEMAGGYTPGWHAFLDRLDQMLAGNHPDAWDDLFARLLPKYRPADA